MVTAKINHEASIKNTTEEWPGSWGENILKRKTRYAPEEIPDQETKLVNTIEYYVILFQLNMIIVTWTDIGENVEILISHRRDIGMPDMNVSLK